MNASLDFCSQCLTRLRGMVRLPKDMQAPDLDLQLADYARALTRHEPRDVEIGCMSYAETHKWWPTLSELLEAVAEARGRRQTKAALRAQGGDNFITRCQRLGFQAGRMSAIGVSSWAPILDHAREHGMADHDLISALEWCEEHPGRTWKLQGSAATAESIRETCKLVEAMRANPSAYIAAANLVAIGEAMIIRHIEAGRAPPDVASWYGHLMPAEAA